MLPYKLQRKFLAGGLERRGINSDVFDLHAEIDRTLTFSENKRLIQKKTGFIKEKDYGTLGRAKMELEARDIQDKRSYKAKFMDRKINARRTFFIDDIEPKEFKRWKKNPNRYDIRGVDR